MPAGGDAMTRDPIPISEYIAQSFVPISHLAHNWELHAAVPLTRSQERTMVREPAGAVPESIAQRVGNLRVLLVPYIGCSESGDLVSFVKPEGESHSAVWTETPERTSLVLACRELDPHDTGFEFLASIAELIVGRLQPQELERYSRLLAAELENGTGGEIDEESYSAKQALVRQQKLRRPSNQYERYRELSLIGTLAEYMHSLWHDVQIRLGPEHLPVPQLRRRMDLLAEMFPPSPGTKLFAQDVEPAQ